MRASYRVDQGCLLSSTTSCSLSQMAAHPRINSQRPSYQPPSFPLIPDLFLANPTLTLPLRQFTTRVLHAISLIGRLFGSSAAPPITVRLRSFPRYNAGHGGTAQWRAARRSLCSIEQSLDWVKGGWGKRHRAQSKYPRRDLGQDNKRRHKLCVVILYIMLYAVIGKMQLDMLTSAPPAPPLLPGLRSPFPASCADAPPHHITSPHQYSNNISCFLVYHSRLPTLSLLLCILRRFAGWPRASRRNTPRCYQKRDKIASA
jgi:hypothetical protein